MSAPKCHQAALMGSKTFLKDKKFCDDGFQKKKIYKDQNSNERYLQGRMSYLSLAFSMIN